MGKTVKKIIGIAGVIGLIVVTGGAALFAAAGFGVSLSSIITGLSISFSAISYGFAPEFDLGNASRRLAENLSIFSSPTAVRSVAFGRAGIAGQVLFRKNITNSGATPDELLLILGLAGYPATSLEKFWFNGELVFDGDSTTGPGAITSGTFANDLWVWFRTGEETSAAFPDIASLSSEWDAKTRVLRGIPSIGIRIKVTEKVDGKLQPLAQIKAAKLYDPRLDSSVPGGSGTHDFDDPSTWEWSENPKLAELLYLRGADINGTRIFGMGKSRASIDLENFASEANICEEQISVVGGGTIDRYTCNGVLVPNSSHKTNLQLLLSASASTMDASGGIYRTFAGAWRASLMTLTESDIDGAPTSVQLQIDQSNEVNIIGGSFADPADEWVVKEYPELTDAASIASFGENAKKLDMPFTTDHRIAQRISKVQMKRVNAKRAFNANYWLRAMPLQPGDIVTQTYSRYGISAETFRIDFWSLEASEDRRSNRRLIVPLRLIEEQQSWFDWDEATEEQSTPTITSLPSVSRLPRLITLDDTIVFEGASPPANPKVGWLWLDTDVNIVFRWNGSVWVEFSKIGADGLSIKVATVYKRASSAPSTPAADDGSYNFGTQTLTPPTGWSTEPPAADGNPLYYSAGVFEIQGTTGTDSTVTWSAPQVLVPDSIYRDIKFKRSTSAPATPTGDNPAGWFDEVPTGTDVLWQTTGTKDSSGGLIGVWSTPERVQGLTFRGTYAAGTAYIIHDIVLYSERTYICVQAGTGNAPSGTNAGNAYWDLIAGKGDTGDPPTPFTETIAITGSGPVNLRGLADAHSPAYDGIADATITFTVGSGITLSGNAGVADGGHAGHAVDTGTWPAGATIALTLENEGTIRGGGGAGGKGGGFGGNGFDAGDAGDAIYCQEDLTIDNAPSASGTIQAGGGGGGGGGSRNTGGAEPVDYPGGGGGGGFPNGEGGAKGTGSGGAAGAAGTGSGGGTGGGGANTAGDGGDGGNVNVNGATGDNATGSGGTNGTGAFGGTKGYALRKNGHTASITGGTVTGTQG